MVYSTSARSNKMGKIDQYSHKFPSSTEIDSIDSINEYFGSKNQFKDCFRKTVTCMCSQIGVIGLIIGYTLIGAVCFMELELKGVDTNFYEAEKLRNDTAEQFWNITNAYNIFNKSAFVNSSEVLLENYQNKLVLLIRDYYDGRKLETKWSYPAALMFSLSTMTMIGYGDIAPRTIWGKICTVTYTVFGIPLYVLYFLNVGKGLAQIFRWGYIKLVQCTSPPSLSSSKTTIKRRIVVPSTACLWIITGYILFGTVMFAEWEKWSYLDSSYFCITSLCKLGFGDLVPGNITTKSGNQLRLVMNYFYVFFGQGLVAMCYHLMSEDVRIKLQEISEDFRECLRDTQTKLGSCFKQKRNVQTVIYYK